MSAISLGFVFTGRDLASRTFSKVDANFGRLERNTARSSKMMQASMAAVAGGMAAMAIGFVALKKQFDFADAAGKFQQQLVATSRIMIDGTQNLDALRNKALDVGLRTPFAPTEIMSGLRGLAELGFESAQAIATIEPAANLAVLGQIKLDKASKAIAGTLRAFNMDASKSGDVADRLGLITQQSGFQAVDFANGLSKGAATMGRFGQSLEDTLVLMGAMRDMNIRSSVASTNMREAARRVFSQQSAVNKIRAAGIATIDAETGKRRRLVDILFDMAEHTKTLSTTQGDLFASSVLGARGADMLTGVIRKGRKSFDKDIKAMNESAGTAKNFMDAMLDTFQGQKDLLRGASETFKVVIGEAFADVLKPVVAFMVNSLTDITRLIRDAPAPMKRAAAAVSLLAAGLLALTGAGVLFVGVFGMAMVLMTSFAGITLASVGVFAAIVGSIALVTAGIIGLTTAADSNLASAEGLKKFWADVTLIFDGVKQALSGDGIKGDTLFKLVKDENRDLLIWVVNISRWINRAKHFIKGMWSGFKAGIEQARPELEAFNKAFADLGKVLGISNDENELMNTSVSEATRSGANFGKTLSNVAVIGIKFMTSMIELSTLLIDNFETLKNTLMLIAGVIAGAAFMRLGSMMGMGAGAGAARAAAAGGAGAGLMGPMMLGGMASSAAGLSSKSPTGISGNATPMSGRFSSQDLSGAQAGRSSFQGIALPAAEQASRRDRMKGFMKERGGVKGMVKGGLSRGFGAIGGLMGAGMVAQGANQASEGNWGTGAMTAGMGAMMIGKGGFATAMAVVSKHPVVLGTIAAGVASGLAAKHFIEKKGDSEIRAIAGVLGGGAQTQYLADNDLNQRVTADMLKEQMTTVHGRDQIRASGQGHLANVRTGKQSDYYKNRQSHWAQMDAYKSMGIDASNMATRNSQGAIMGGRGDGGGGGLGGGGDFVAWSTSAHLAALRAAHKEGLTAPKISVNTTYSEFAKAGAESKNLVSDGAFANTPFLGSGD